METTIVYWSYNGIMEKKMETTIYGPPQQIVYSCHSVPFSPPRALSVLTFYRDKVGRQGVRHA